MTGWLWKGQPLLLPLIAALTAAGVFFPPLSSSPSSSAVCLSGLRVGACPIKGPPHCELRHVVSSAGSLSVQAALSAGQTRRFVFIF